MYIDTSKFKSIQQEPDAFERSQAHRVLIGRLTRKRYEFFRQVVRQVLTDRFPYGKSPNGYPYSCGCEHDCCGCICGIYGNFTIQHWMGGFKVTLYQTIIRNY